MDEQFQLVFEEHPDDSTRQAIFRGLDEFNLKQVGDANFTQLCFVLRGPNQAIMGGVLGQIFYGGLFIDTLWVAEGLRGLGHGGRLLQSIEDEARKRGAGIVFLDTFSFQAPEFYKRHGYRVFGELPDFPPGQRLLFFTKKL